MLRFTIALLFVMVVSGTAIGADQAMARRSWHRAAVILPAGLPRSHYHFRTTISYGTPYTYRRFYGPRVSVYEAPELPYGPDYAAGPYLPPLIRAPPGYYGSAYRYDYHGPYYGGPYVGYWDRLPYACGVYGYC